jgi:uncharacterized protein YggU (UPF0235/DUF167 family)
MRLAAHVTPRARRPGVERQPDGTLRVAVSEPPHDGRANDAVVALVAAHFGVARSRVRIVQGRRGRRKIIEVAAAP